MKMRMHCPGVHADNAVFVPETTATEIAGIRALQVDEQHQPILSMEAIKRAQE